MRTDGVEDAGETVTPEGDAAIRHSVRMVRDERMADYARLVSANARDWLAARRKELRKRMAENPGNLAASLRIARAKPSEAMSTAEIIRAFGSRNIDEGMRFSVVANRDEAATAGDETPAEREASAYADLVNYLIRGATYIGCESPRFRP